MSSPINTPSHIIQSTVSEKKIALYENKKEPEAKIVKSQFIREMPQKVTFEKEIEYHDLTPQIQIAVSSYKELITGTEMVIDSENEEAKELIDSWLRRTQFYDKFENLVATILITGNGILEKLDEKNTDDVEEVDMSTIISKKRTDTGELEYYEQRQQQGKIVRLGEGNLERFIEFNLTNYSKQAWGKSLFYSLAVPRVTGHRITAPLIEIMWGMEDAMGAIVLNNAYPITTITYPGANDEYLEKEAERWRRYKPGDKRVQKIKPEIEFFETQPGSKYTDYVAHIENTFELGTQFPHDIMTGDFTSRASSETTETIVMKKVRGYQRYLANRLKTALFDVILEQNGIDPEEADLQVSFAAQNVIELEPTQVAKLYTDKIISITEVREWFKANTGMDLPDDEQMVQAELDRITKSEEGEPQVKKDLKSLEHRIERIASENDTDKKISEMTKTLEHKLDLVKEAVATQKTALAERRIKILDKLLEEAEKIG